MSWDNKIINRWRDTGRPMSDGECALARQMFSDAIDTGRVRLHLRKWWALQPRHVVMAPDGSIWFHPGGTAWRDDFSNASLGLQALLIHELTHVWQHQSGIFLPLRRHPFCRYRYVLMPGKPLSAYGIEQQATMVEHTFIARRQGAPVPALEILLAEAFA